MKVNIIGIGSSVVSKRKSAYMDGLENADVENVSRNIP
jgi:hypothetical protein